MTQASTPALKDIPKIMSLSELYSVALVLGGNMVRSCERLAAEMKACRNEAAAQVFQCLAEREGEIVRSIRAQAENAGATLSADIDDAWLEPDLRGDLAREIADNPYLMTPYRALRLAVINKQRVFEILSTLAAGQEDDVIRDHAEALARGRLSEIAELRLRRRRASRSEIKTAIEKAGFGAAPVEIETFNDIVATVHAMIYAMAGVVRRSWAAEMTDGTERVLRDLLEEFRGSADAPAGNENRAALEARIKRENDTLFSALKSLMRELESAVDLFLGYAESAVSEQVVDAAQTAAERYVRRIAEIRDQLNLRVSA